MQLYSPWISIIRALDLAKPLYLSMSLLSIHGNELITNISFVCYIPMHCTALNIRSVIFVLWFLFSEYINTAEVIFHLNVI